MGRSSRIIIGINGLPVVVDKVDEAGLARIGANVAAQLQAGDVIALSGELGAGKTTFARAILRALGHRGEVPSPTFTLAQSYADLSPPVLHCDLYRLQSADEAEVLGLDDWLVDGALLLEWPERLGDHIWDDCLWLRLEGAAAPWRRLTWTVGSAWSDRWPAIELS